MYGLKQAAILSYTQVSTPLKKSGYQPIICSLGMWKHHTKRTLFYLCVDDFGIKYYDKDDIQHLEYAPKPQYTAKIDWEGKNFLGFTLGRDHKTRHVILTIPNYVKRH